MRFDRGDLVYVKVADGWVPGTILKQNVDGMAYRIRLKKDHGGAEVYAPRDSDFFVCENKPSKEELTSQAKARAKMPRRFRTDQKVWVRTSQGWATGAVTSSSTNTNSPEYHVRLQSGHEVEIPHDSQWFVRKDKPQTHSQQDHRGSRGNRRVCIATALSLFLCSMVFVLFIKLPSHIPLSSYGPGVFLFNRAPAKPVWLVRSRLLDTPPAPPPLY